MSRRRRRKRSRQRKHRRGGCVCERGGGSEQREGEACRATCQETWAGGNTQGHWGVRWSVVFVRLEICSSELQNGVQEKRKALRNIEEHRPAWKAFHLQLKGKCPRCSS